VPRHQTSDCLVGVEREDVGGEENDPEAECQQEDGCRGKPEAAGRRSCVPEARLGRRLSLAARHR
jgi:hypothetical protein